MAALSVQPLSDVRLLASGLCNACLTPVTVVSKAGKALQAVIALAEHHAEHQGPVITLDLEKAFDTVDPRLALDVLARAGAPRQWLSLVKRVWLNQTRWIQYGRAHS